MAKDTLPRFTMRIPQFWLDRLHYIARYEGRTANKQLEQMVKQLTEDFESKHGEITEDMISEMNAGK